MSPISGQQLHWQRGTGTKVSDTERRHGKQNKKSAQSWLPSAILDYQDNLKELNLKSQESQDGKYPNTAACRMHVDTEYQ